MKAFNLQKQNTRSDLNEKYIKRFLNALKFVH